MRKTWRLQGSGETCYIAPRSLVSQEEQAAYLSAQLDRWLADPLAHKTVLEIYETLRGHSALLARRLRGQELHRFVKSEILEAFRRGELVLMRLPHITIFPAIEKPREAEAAIADEPPPTEEPKRKEKSWIGVEVVDQDGNPVPGVKYQLELPDGKTRTGQLDNNGQVLVRDIDPGTCLISFPELDAREWEGPEGTTATPVVSPSISQAAEPPPPAPAPVSTPEDSSPAEEPTTALNIRLLRRGKARSGVTYTLSVDGSPLTGSTDAQGTIHQPVSEGAAEAQLTVETSSVTEEYSLAIGALPPLEELKGGQARLSNLGYRTGPVDGTMGSRTRNALRQFQSDTGLSVTCEYDDATRKKLREVHDEGKIAGTEAIGSSAEATLVDHERYAFVFPSDKPPSQSIETSTADGGSTNGTPAGKLRFSRTVNLSPSGNERFNVFDRLPPPAMLEIEDAIYHHNSCVTLPALPTFGRRPRIPEQRGEEGEFTKAVKQFHPLVHNDFWQRSVGGVSAEEEHWQRSGMVYVAVVYLFLKQNPSYTLLLAGHTDTTGQDEYNFELGDLRAQNFLHLLRGDRKKWVENSMSRTSVEDKQRIVKHFGRRRRWGCDPGDINGEDSETTREAVRCLQSHFNEDFGASLEVDGKFGRETWGAIFDLYMNELAQLLETTVEGLDVFRQELRFASAEHSTITCGERIPVDEPQRDNFRSSTNRRVEVLFFHASDTPDLTAHLPGGKIRSGKAGREASDIYGPESPKFVVVNPRWWEHPASPNPFEPRFRIEELGTEESDEVDSEVPIGVVDPGLEESDPWTFLDPFKEFDPGSSGKDDFQNLMGSEDRANV